MSEEIKDGGPVFPTVTMETNMECLESGISRQYQVQWRGLTKREWFAGMALQGLLAKHGDAGWCHLGEVQSMADAAETCFQYADSMLKEGSR